MKKIGILGSGAVAKTLGGGFLKHGYEVMLGTRSADKLEEWKAANQGAQVGSFEEAAAFADIVVLAVKGTAAKSALELAGANNLSGKIVIDTTNPIDGAPTNGVLNFFTEQNHSLMEQLQSAFPRARFVKSWNSIGSAFMVNPDFGGEKPAMFICGNDENARKEVSEILVQFGFEVEDMGMAEAARAIEPLCMLWCIPGFREGRWSNAFRLLKK
ncbi:MAG: NAD(P)-binding domain-containing protein [Flavobacteriales bacterium]|nr:NAD(P)-binding domain-containing protein [Flavobacteriales bacterium]MCB9191252.1 NAD(P)-binding domain-containing protein [Flavobacteriales bacterium]MCB9204257.1 NAD(P)-binding domain-containing protein [Flavobacteriales bacterium]